MPRLRSRVRPHCSNLIGTRLASAFRIADMLTQFWHGEASQQTRIRNRRPGGRGPRSRRLLSPICLHFDKILRLRDIPGTCLTGNRRWRGRPTGRPLPQPHSPRRCPRSASAGNPVHVSQTRNFVKEGRDSGKAAANPPLPTSDAQASLLNRAGPYNALMEANPANILTDIADRRSFREWLERNHATEPDC